MARTGRVYVLRDPDGNMVYCGSSEDPYRLTRHRGQCKSDGLASPLYRYANEHHGGMAGYTEEIVATNQTNSGSLQPIASAHSSSQICDARCAC